MTEPHIVRIALFGPSGAGKSTTSHLISAHCETSGVKCSRLALAEPLYKAQAELYKIARRPLADPEVQDGELLALLGRQLRRINPTVLTDDFSARLHDLITDISLEKYDRYVVVCDDMRYPDWAALGRLEFVPVRIYATEDDCDIRRRLRGDINMVSSASWTEHGLDMIPYVHTLNNTGTIADLAMAVTGLLEELSA
ncbi:ATP-binding protein [Nocardia aurantia]|uniref:Uncharacterized protein n=1 Tax=Nocardia aurantia TaxID=2585199 RepID=A0A7K0DSR5_9NOCA|nr:ATP-binding protein [Nocardia aurantia]MQY28791.1 hypothetical protein [Nocardia aurantia]